MASPSQENICACFLQSCRRDVGFGVCHVSMCTFGFLILCLFAPGQLLIFRNIPEVIKLHKAVQSCLPSLLYQIFLGGFCAAVS